MTEPAQPKAAIRSSLCEEEVEDLQSLSDEDEEEEEDREDSHE
jgi:hypothetical protein